MTRERFDLPGGGYFETEGHEELLQFLRESRDLNHYVAVVDRPGTRMLVAVWEHHLFSPGTPANNDFHLRRYRWHACGDTPFYIVSMPRIRHAEVCALAQRCFMRVQVGQPGVCALKHQPNTVLIVTVGEHSRPRLKAMGAAEPVLFPGASRFMFNVENDSQRSPVYKLTARSAADVVAREVELIRCFGVGDLPSPEQCANFVFGTGEKPA